MPLRTSQDEQLSLNMTPIIDVFLLLLIFFMMGTTFIDMERNIELKLPEVADRGALTAAPEKKVVNVYRDGVITLDRSPVTLDQLTKRLTESRRQYSDLGVLIRGDGQVNLQRTAEVLNACKQAGVVELAISVRLSTPKR